MEGRYLQRLALEEEKEESKLRAERKEKRQKTAPSPGDGEAASEKSDEEDKDEDEKSAGSDTEELSIPQHESLQAPKDSPEFEQASRTVFLGNVSSQAIASKSAKKVLLTHLSSFLSSLPPNTPPHSVESFRFRSTAYSNKLPKKAAFAKKEIMDTTTKSTNAYVVYSTKLAAKEAAKRLNGTIVLDRHLRADEVAHPAKTDHHRCIFVGNLGFVDDESQIREANEQEGQRKQKKREPGDVEEGLWREFGKVGKVESVRVVRDPKTRVGKGFAYVQFIVVLLLLLPLPLLILPQDENSVEAALLHNDKKFPPLLPRKLRVTRAKAVKRNAPPKDGQRPKINGIYNPKVSTREKSMQGRARKMLGRAGAAQAKQGRNGALGDMRAPESFVFEGHRASKGQGLAGLKLGGSGKKKGKPRNRSAKRGAAFKAAGGVKKTAK
jgi:nucleolar protein 12